MYIGEYLENVDSGFGICKTDLLEQLIILNFTYIFIETYAYLCTYLENNLYLWFQFHIKSFKNLNTEVLRLDGYGIQKWILFSKSRSFLGGKLLLFIIMSDIDFPGYYAYQMISKSSSLSVSHCGEIIFEGEIFYSHNCFQEYFILEFSDMTIQQDSIKFKP